MLEVREPQTKLFFEQRVTLDKTDRPEYSAIYEGEIPMSEQEQEALKSLLGDGGASVTVSREIGEMSYGNGGKCFASVTIKCDLSQAGIEAAQGWAAHFASKFVETQHGEMKAQVQRLGIIQ